jgi:hypothetical protein
VRLSAAARLAVVLLLPLLCAEQSELAAGRVVWGVLFNSTKNDL